MPNRLPLAALVLLVLGACTERTGPTGVAAVMPISASSHTAATGGLATLFEREYVRATGKPLTETVTVSSAGFEAPFRLTVHNGLADGSARVSSAEILVNGVTVVAPNAFSPNTEWIERDLDAAGEFVIDVRLASAPGSRLTVRIEAAPGVTRFCPADAGDGVSYAHLDSAVAATDSGGTVLVCDGVHTVGAAFVTRPMTIRSENPGGATLVGTAFTVFTVGGFTGGTVRIADLAFSHTGASIRIAHPIDSVIVDSSRFEPPAGAPFGGNAVATFGAITPGTTPVIIIRGNTIVRAGGAAVIVAAAHGVAVGNTVDSTFGSGIVLMTSVSGRIADNHLVRGGLGHGIRLESPTGTGVIEDNVLMRSGPASGPTAIVGQSAVVIRRNTIVGLTAGPTHSWTFGIQASAAAGGAPVIQNNVIHNANTALRLLDLPVGISVHDNVVTGAFVGIGLATGALNVHVRINRNDISASAASFGSSVGVILGDLTCNWWGTVTGAPIGVGGIPPATYTPWSTVPIANVGAVVCP